jgi:hypothetical protein
LLGGDALDEMPADGRLDIPRGRKVEVGEVAADTPATNAGNQIASYLPLLGTPPARSQPDAVFCAMSVEAVSGTATADVAFDGGRLGVPLEQAVALQVATMDSYARSQVFPLSPSPPLPSSQQTFPSSEGDCTSH